MTEKSNLRKILAESGLLGLHRTKNVDLRESGLVRKVAIEDSVMDQLIDLLNPVNQHFTSKNNIKHTNHIDNIIYIDDYRK